MDTATWYSVLAWQQNFKRFPALVSTMSFFIFFVHYNVLVGYSESSFAIIKAWTAMPKSNAPQPLMVLFILHKMQENTKKM